MIDFILSLIKSLNFILSFLDRIYRLSSQSLLTFIGYVISSEVEKSKPIISICRDFSTPLRFGRNDMRLAKGGKMVFALSTS